MRSGTPPRAVVPGRPVRGRLLTALAGALAVCCAAAAPAPAAPDSPAIVKQARFHGRTLALETHIDTHSELDQIGRALTAQQARKVLSVSGESGTAAFAAPASGADYLADTWCGTERNTDDSADAVHSSLPVIKVIYAYPSDQADRFSTYKDVIQAQAKSISDLVASTSGQAKSLRFDLGTSCGPAYVDVQSIQLANNLAYYQAHDVSTRFDTILTDVHAQVPATSQKRNYLIYADYLGGGGFPASGQGELWNDDSAGAGNAANDGELNAVLYGTGAQFFTSSSQANGNVVPLHEITHNLGGVQDTAPHSTLAGHCYDEWDVECYADGGAHGAPSDMTYTCGASNNQVYDCGTDDFFNANPSGGSYLATHWNVYNNVFLCALASCGAGGSDTTPPDTTVTAGPASSTPATDASFVFTSSEPGSTFSCQMDGLDWTACLSPQGYPWLAPGQTHTFSVRATDPNGNVDPSPATYSWTITAPAPPPTPPTATTATNTSTSSALTGTRLARMVGLPSEGAAVRVTYRRKNAFVNLGRATCQPACAGAISLYAIGVPRSLRLGRTVNLGRRAFSLAVGSSASLEITVTAKGRRLLRRKKHIRVSVTLAARDRGGQPVWVQRTLLLKSR